MERTAIVSDCKPPIYAKADTTGIKIKKVSEYQCESYYTSNGILINIITCDSKGNFYLYDCIPAIPKKISKSDNPLKLKVGDYDE
jgi:hypothetical protein